MSDKDLVLLIFLVSIVVTIVRTKEYIEAFKNRNKEVTLYTKRPFLLTINLFFGYVAVVGVIYCFLVLWFDNGNTP